MPTAHPIGIQLRNPDGTFGPLPQAAALRQQKAFVENLAALGNMTEAAELAGTNRMQVLRWQESDPAFADAVQDARERALDKLEGHLYKRAFQNDVTGYFIIKGGRPQYRDNAQVNVNVGVQVGDIDRTAEEYYAKHPDRR